MLILSGMITDSLALRLSFFIGLLALMFLLETVKPARSWHHPRKKRLLFSAGLAVVNNIVMRLTVVAPFVFLTEYVADHQWGLSPFLGLSGLPEILITILLFDFLDTLKHKWYHRVPLLWRFHRVHHTDTHLDVLTALRYHPIEFMISAGFKCLWIVLWGPSMVAFLVFEIFLNICSEFHHSNIDFPDKIEGVLNKFMVTPRYHAIHHTRFKDSGDYNFALFLNVWDHVLNCYKAPDLSVINFEKLEPEQRKMDLNLIETLKAPFTDFEKKEELVMKNLSHNSMLEGLKEGMRKSQALLLDVRETKEIEESGTIEGAVCLPTSEITYHSKMFQDFAEQTDKNKKLYIYCGKGVRAEKMCKVFQQKGFDTENLGGFQDLKSYFPVIQRKETPYETRK